MGGSLPARGGGVVVVATRSSSADTEDGEVVLFHSAHSSTQTPAVSLSVMPHVNDFDCAICLSSLVNPRPFPAAACPHIFCAECLSTLESCTKSRGLIMLCPVCRRPCDCGLAAEAEDVEVERSTRFTRLRAREAELCGTSGYDHPRMRHLCLTIIMACVLGAFVMWGYALRK
jgi:hypothetical protein